MAKEKEEKKKTAKKKKPKIVEIKKEDKKILDEDLEEIMELDDYEKEQVFARHGTTLAEIEGAQRNVNLEESVADVAVQKQEDEDMNNLYSSGDQTYSKDVYDASPDNTKSFGGIDPTSSERKIAGMGEEREENKQKYNPSQGVAHPGTERDQEKQKKAYEHSFR